MLRAEMHTWTRFLPGYGACRILIDGGLTGGFEIWALLITPAWLGGLLVIASTPVRLPGGAQIAPGARGCLASRRMMDVSSLHRTFTARPDESPSVECRL